MDYSESVLYLKAYIKKYEDAINKRKFRQAYEISEEIKMEARQLEAISFNILEMIDEQVR